MGERMVRLLEAAYAVVDARRANEELFRARRELAGGGAGEDEAGPLARAVELVLEDFDGFARVQLPRLVYHLESIGAALPSCGGVLIAGFVGDRLHLFRAADFIARAGELVGLSAAEMIARYGTGELDTATTPRLALPPGD